MTAEASDTSNLLLQVAHYVQAKERPLLRIVFIDSEPLGKVFPLRK